MKTMIAWLVLIAVLAASPVAAAPAPNNIVKIRDYAAGDCVADDTVAFQNAINTAENTPGIGVLDLTTGCYSISSTLHVGKPSPGQTFLEIRGDGPNLAQIKAAGGIGRAIEFDDWLNSRMGGFSVTGAGDGTWGAGANTDMGLVLAARHADLGACCGTIHDLNVNGFQTCWMLGDPQPPYGAAAEFVMENVGASYCGEGFTFVSYNTLDFVFLRSGGTFNRTLFHSVNGGQLVIDGGGATGNGQDFWLGAVAPTAITGFRSEGRHDPNQPAIILEGWGQTVSIRNSVFDASSLSSPVSIQINQPAFLELVNTTLNGKVLGPADTGLFGVISAALNPIWSSDVAFDLNTHWQLYAKGNAKLTKGGNGFLTGYFWDNSDGWVTAPSGTSTSTPLPTNTPTPTRTPTPTATPTPAGYGGLSASYNASTTTVTATWTTPQTHGSDYILVSAVGSPDLANVAWEYIECNQAATGTPTGTCAVSLANVAPGTYELRYVARVPGPDHITARSGQFVR